MSSDDVKCVPYLTEKQKSCDRESLVQQHNALFKLYYQQYLSYAGCIVSEYQCLIDDGIQEDHIVGCFA